MSKKSRFLKSVLAGGVAETRKKLALGQIKREVPVDVEKELVEAKTAIGNNSQVIALGITDDDLRDVIVRVAQAHQLTIKMRDGALIAPEEKKTGVMYEGLKEGLRRDAKHHVEKGTIKLPVDPEEFASRLEKGPVHLNLTHADYVRAIREVCVELGLEVKA